MSDAIKRFCDEARCRAASLNRGTYITSCQIDADRDVGAVAWKLSCGKEQHMLFQFTENHGGLRKASIVAGTAIAYQLSPLTDQTELDILVKKANARLHDDVPRITNAEAKRIFEAYTVLDCVCDHPVETANEGNTGGASATPSTGGNGEERGSGGESAAQPSSSDEYHSDSSNEDGSDSSDDTDAADGGDDGSSSGDSSSSSEDDTDSS